MAAPAAPALQQEMVATPAEPAQNGKIVEGIPPMDNGAMGSQVKVPKAVNVNGRMTGTAVLKQLGFKGHRVTSSIYLGLPRHPQGLSRHPQSLPRHLGRRLAGHMPQV